VPTLIQRGRKGELPPLVDPNVARDFIHVDDVVEAYLLAAQTQESELGPVYNVGTGVETTIGEAVRIARLVMNVAAQPVWNTMPNRSWDATVWVSDNRKIRDRLHWQPRHDFESDLRMTLDWFGRTLSRPRSARPEPNQPSRTG
jgi:nucleoside-diphosphate-sugar epimerase